MPAPYCNEHDRYLANYRETGQAKIIGIGREVVGRRRDGTVFPLHLAVSEVRLGDRRLFTGIVHDLSERKRLEEAVLAIGDRERRRIGQDLHDGLGQLLAAIAFKSRLLQKKLPDGTSEAATATAQQIVELTSQAITQARAIAHGLQPVEPRPLGLVSALHALATSTSELLGIRCEFECPQPLPVEEPTIATHLYRIAQEAVNNAVKHGKASQISLSFLRNGPNLVLRICDDGTGFRADRVSKSTGMGLRTMRYRAAMISGLLSVSGDPKRGGAAITCTVQCTQ
jgi:two-component system CheB/CheR fusion protein